MPAEVQRETIVAAAIQHDGLVFSLPRPARHHNIIYSMSRAGLGPQTTSRQGFLTSRGVFVDRVVALAIAMRADQIFGEKNGDPNQLFSEDVW